MHLEQSGTFLGGTVEILVLGDADGGTGFDQRQADGIAFDLVTDM